MEPPLAFRAVAGLNDGGSEAQPGTAGHVYRTFQRRLATLIPSAPPVRCVPERSLPSSTLAGKTTTLAKLAARVAIERGTVRIVSLDGEILGGRGQPETFAAVRAFAALGVTHLLFTRLDETTTEESLLTVAVEAGMPLSYFATGREIPDDLRPATASELLRRIVHGAHAR
jgi:flagellar biosynthesis GTPase FlhF